MLLKNLTVNITMIELKKNFSRSFGEFKQICNDKELVVYEVTKAYKNGQKTTWYEVFKYRISKPNKFVNDDYESYPSSVDFGTWAWCCSNPSCVAKVIEEHFPNHPTTKLLQQFIDGTYFSGGVERNHFSIGEKDLYNMLISWGVGS